MSNDITATGLRPSNAAHAESDAAPTPTPQAPPKPLDQSQQETWAHDEFSETLGSPGFIVHFPSDSSVRELMQTASTLSGDSLRKVLAKLDAEGKLGRLSGLDTREQEAFLHLLAERGLLTESRQPWKGGSYSVPPPALFDGKDLPPALRNLVDQRNARAARDYADHVEALRASLAAQPTAHSVPAVRTEQLGEAKALGRTPEEQARFELGTKPTLGELTSNPLQALDDGAKWARSQTDLVRRAKSLAVGDEAEVQLGGDSKLKAVISRTDEHAYEVSLTAEAFLSLGGTLKGEVEGVGVEVGAQVLEGRTGKVTLSLSSPEELAQLVAALRAQTAQGNGHGALAAAVTATEFIDRHLKSWSVGRKLEGEVEVGAELLHVGGEAKGKLADGVELERTRLADGRIATSSKEELEVVSGLALGVGVTLSKGEELTRVTFEKTSISPAKPGEEPTSKLVVVVQKRSGDRVDTRKLEIEVPAGKEEAFRQAFARNDRAAMKALIEQSRREETSTTVYEQKLPFGVGHSIDRRRVASGQTGAERE